MRIERVTRTYKDSNGDLCLQELDEGINKVLQSHIDMELVEIKLYGEQREKAMVIMRKC